MDHKNDKTAGARPSVRLQPQREVPAPSPDDPSDDELLRYLDGALSEQEVAELERRLLHSPHAAARVEILTDALEDWDNPLRPPPAKA